VAETPIPLTISNTVIDMLTYEEALETLLQAARPVSGTEDIDSHLALGRILAEPVFSSVNVPPADNSAMDGYAVRLADLGEDPARLPVGLRVPAGAAPSELPAGVAARIFTGAPVPAGADAVIPQEKCTAEDCRPVRDWGLRISGCWRR